MRPSLFCDFANTRRLDPRFSFSRASAKWPTDRYGLKTQVLANVAGFDHGESDGETYGVLLEEARTNYCRYNRDLTQAARWTLSNCTAAKNTTGIDGVASSASTLTATGANATALQTIAGSTGSATRIFGAWVRRKTGTGSVYITQNNGGTWTEITSSINSTTWTRCAMPSATVASPVCGFKMATSGDEIEVDYCQHEIGAFLTSAIGCPADADVTRSADICSASAADWYNQREGTFIVRFRMPTGANDSIRRLITVSDDTDTNNRVSLVLTASKVANLYSSNGLSNLSTANAYTSDAFNTVAVRIKDGGFGVCLNGGAVAENAAHVKPTQILSSFLLGTSTAGLVQPCGTIARLAYYPYALSNAAMQALSS